MAGRQFTRKASALIKFANLVRFRENSLMVLRNPSKLNIGGVMNDYVKSVDSKRKNFVGENHWNSHNFSRGINADFNYDYGETNYGPGKFSGSGFGSI